MGFYDLLKMSTRMFKARTSRTLLTILGMGVGIGAILFLVSLGYGIQKTLLETITTEDSLLSLDVYPRETAQVISQEEAVEIAALPGVDFVSSVYETEGKLRLETMTTDSKIFLVDDRFINLTGLKMVAGESLNDQEANGVVISQPLAKVFEKNPTELIGMNISVNLAEEDSIVIAGGATIAEELNFKIIGVLEDKDTTIYINKKFSGNVEYSQYSKLKIKGDSSNSVTAVRRELESRGFIVSALTDVVDQVNKVFKIIRIILGFFGAIALIVSAIGMFNTMTVSLLERTEEIGIMKSIGASDYDVLWMFVFESTLMGFLGGIAGVILGLLGGKIFNVIINVLAQGLGGYSTSLFYYPIWFLIFIIVVATVVGFFTGIIPAKRASSTDPLDALRYK